MPHYDTGEWTDFVRGLTDSSRSCEMENHLGRCQACQRTVRSLRHVADLARVDRELEFPDHLVRWARAVFSGRSAEPTGRLIARLVYDSLAAPQLAGVRAQNRISRHLLYEAGEFGLDLQLEYERGSSRATLVGQILDREQPERSMSDVAVRLVRGRTEIGRTRCNRFGEFQIEYEPKGRLRLNVIERSRSYRVEVSLNGLQGDQPGA